MSMDFGKTNRSVAFNPTSAFPLDARSYFESYKEAVAAAATAEPAGSTNSVYYFGQTIAVVEEGKATLYTIQPDKTLSTIGDTYTKVEIDAKIAAADHLKRKIVKNIAEIEQYIENNTDYNEYIFMVPNGPQDYDDKYDEYIVIKEFDSDNVFLGEHIEKVGSWEVDLDDYAKKSDLTTYAKITDLGAYAKISDLETLLNSKYVTKKTDYDLVSNKDIEKLAKLEEIFSVDTTQFSLTNGKLSISIIDDLETQLNQVTQITDKITALESQLKWQQLQ